MATLLEQAGAHIKAGDTEKAKHLLVEVIKQNPRDENAWLWMSRCVSNVEQKKDCFERVLVINPQNLYAIEGLNRLNNSVPNNSASKVKVNQQQPALGGVTASAQPQPARPRVPTLNMQATVNQMKGEAVEEKSAPRMGSTRTMPSKSASWLRYWPIGLVGFLCLGVFLVAGIVALMQGLILYAVPDSTEAPIPSNAPEEITDDKSIVMRLVPAGPFTMGGSAAVAYAACQKFYNEFSDTYCQYNSFTDEEPVHTVNLESFYMDKYEVSNAAWRECVSSGTCQPPDNTTSDTRSSYYGDSKYDNYPVIYVNWNQAVTYCEWRGARLPTEAEWEKAARGTDGRTYPWGEGIDGNRANYWEGNWEDNCCVEDTTAVGSYASDASPYGQFDMAGNVMEWVADWYSNTFYQSSPSSNPLGPDSSQYSGIGDSRRVVRGGSWLSGDYDVHSSNRLSMIPVFTRSDLGLRCVRSTSP
jgi:formylglycine-generating enzyme required for sulfatase activity